MHLTRIEAAAQAPTSRPESASHSTPAPFWDDRPDFGDGGMTDFRRVDRLPPKFSQDCLLSEGKCP